MKRVALLDGQTIQALPVARSLKRLGYRTALLCDTKRSYGYRTRYADERILSPSTEKAPAEFHAFFLGLVRKERFDALIPLNDYSARYLSLHAGELRPHAAFVIPPYDVFMNGYDKARLMRTCRENGLPHPRSFDLSAAAIGEAAAAVGFPALIKPNLTTGARGFEIVRGTAELEERLPRAIEAYGPCHLQELIPPGGRQFKAELFVSGGTTINATVIHKLRFYPAQGGSSCFNQTVRNDAVVELCSAVLKAIGWVGFADFDLIEDPRDGTIKVMEINPRLPACVKASVSAGVDFVENIMEATLGRPLTEFPYRPGGYLRYLGLDLLWLLQSKDRFRSRPSWFGAWLRRDHHLQDGSLDDPWPFITGTLGGLLKQLSPGFRAAKRGMT